MSLLKSFFRDSFFYVLPSLVARALSFLLIPLYTRFLNPTEYGALDLLMAFGVFVNLTVAMEVAQGAARCYADIQDAKEKTSYASAAFWFSLGSYIIFYVVMYLATPALSPLIIGQKGMDGIFRLACLCMVLNGLFSLASNQFRWDMQSRRYTAINLIMSVVTAVSSIVLVYGFHTGLTGILWAMILGNAVAFLFGLWHLRTTFLTPFLFRPLWNMLSYSFPLVPSGMAVFATYYIDRLMIRHYLSLADVGIYALAYKLASVVTLLMVGFRIALTPLIFSHYKDETTRTQLATLFRLFTAACLMVFMLLSIFAPEILRIVTIPTFYTAASVVIYLLPAIVLSELYIFAPGIDLERKTHWILGINIAAALINIALNSVLIPYFGISGAALSTLVSYCVAFVIYMERSQKYYYVPHHWPPMLVSLAGITLLAVVGTHLSWNVGLLSIGCKTLLLILSGGLIFASGLVKTAEFSDFIRFARQGLSSKVI